MELYLYVYCFGDSDLLIDVEYCSLLNACDEAVHLADSYFCH